MYACCSSLEWSLGHSRRSIFCKRQRTQRSQSQGYWLGGWLAGWLVGSLRGTYCVGEELVRAQATQVQLAHVFVRKVLRCIGLIAVAIGPHERVEELAHLVHDGWCAVVVKRLRSRLRSRSRSRSRSRVMRAVATVGEQETTTATARHGKVFGSRSSRLLDDPTPPKDFVVFRSWPPSPSGARSLVSSLCCLLPCSRALPLSVDLSRRDLSSISRSI